MRARGARRAGRVAMTLHTIALVLKEVALQLDGAIYDDTDARQCSLLTEARALAVRAQDLVREALADTAVVTVTVTVTEADGVIQ
jgi:hypothetical protein